MDPQNELSCKVPEHQGGKVSFACVFPECEQKTRYGCFKCIQQFHGDHFKEVKEFSYIQQEIQKCTQASDSIITKIDDFIKSAYGHLIKFKEQLQQSKDKYQKFPNGLTMSDLDFVLTEIIQYSQGKFSQMLENVNQYINELNNTITQKGSQIFTVGQSQEQEIEKKIIQKDLQPFIYMKLILIQSLFSQDKYQECMKIIEEVLSLDASNVEALHIKANILNNSDMPKQAIPIYEKLLLERPTDIQLQRHRIQSYLRDEQYRKGLDITNELLSKDPSNVDYLEMKAQALLDLGQYEEAQAIFLNLEEEQPLDPMMKFHLGHSLLKLGRIQETISYYEQAITYGHPKEQFIYMEIDRLKKLL